MSINKAGADWLILKARINTMIAQSRDAMEAGQSVEEYNFLRGHIAMAKELIEWVEPTTPPITTEDTYGISDPEA
jgi:hypothetical protein